MDAPNIMKYIPFDKSWMIRMGVLDILHSKHVIREVLRKEKCLADDLKALEGVCSHWEEKTVDVGESGTLFRFLQFISWKQNLGKIFIKHGTLKERKITNDPNIVFLSQDELLQLDNGTSQWASAAALCGDRERINNSPYKLALTYEAIGHWEECEKTGAQWVSRRDQTIQHQAEAFLRLKDGEALNFIPEQSEDYCFARAFDLITADEGERRWPSLRSHETDRITEMERVMKEVDETGKITTRDHRVLQAVVLRCLSEGKKFSVAYPEATNKSWPQFWEFLGFING